KPGAVAAPTAGLHFSDAMLRVLPHVFVTLHVGPGTFRPVHSEDIAEHWMHAEEFSVSQDAAEKINSAKRVVAVGTTTVRVLESTCGLDGLVRAQTGSTNILVYPLLHFRVVDALLTNFHLSRSSLLVLSNALDGPVFIL